MADSGDGVGGAPPPLGAGERLLRLGVIGAVLLGSTAAFAYAGGWLSPGRASPTAVVDNFERGSGGPHVGFRRNHAKGVCLLGWFESEGNAATLSRAAVFARGRVPVVARLAFAGGMPVAPDGAAQVRSLAVRFLPPGGQEWRTGMIDIPVFPFRTGQEFFEQQQASLPDPATGRPDPERMRAFVAAHPGFAAAGALVGARTVAPGFGSSTYNALNTFLLRDAAGVEVPVRWSAVPEARDWPAPVAGTRDALFDAFLAGLATAPARWRLVLTLGEGGDPVDPSRPWPEGRRRVDAGVLAFDRAVGEDGGPCTDVNYDPMVLPDGIAPSADEILSARSAAYSRGFTRREGERDRKPPSAVLPGGAAVRGG